jgi:putative transposase
MSTNIFTSSRKSRMRIGDVYFWTDTIKDWKHLLKPDKYKRVIISELQWLKRNNKIAVYGFVIMPNHLHLLWEMIETNGKEMPHASFNKFTASSFLQDLRSSHPQVLPYFVEHTDARRHRFWQEEPLAVLIDSRSKFEQKLDYIHNNPLQERWNLAKEPEAYRWSSAEFYMTGKDEFGILTHYLDRL